MKKTTLLYTIAILIAIFGALGLFYKMMQGGDGAKVSSSLIYYDKSFTYGNENAKVHIVEFFDPACGACANFHFFLKKIIEKHPDDIKVTLRYAPFFKGSKYVARILEASRKQGKFMEVLELLFKKQDKWASHTNPNLNAIWELLPYLSLDIDKLINDMKDSQISIIIDRDIKDGGSLKINQTPTYFVNAKPLLKFGAKQLEALINSEL